VVQTAAEQPRRAGSVERQLGIATGAVAVVAPAAGPAATVAGYGTAGDAVATGAKLTAKQVQESSEAIIEAIARFWRRRIKDWLPQHAKAIAEAYPDRKPEELRALISEEMGREREFQARQRTRLARDLPKALAEADASKRQAAVNAIIAREKRYLGLREDAMQGRAAGVADLLDVKAASPEGAFWRLSDALKNHTPGCLAAANKFWPWSALKLMSPPVHYGCGCRLHSKDDALAAHWMTDADVQHPKIALNAMRAALSLEENLELYAEPGDAQRLTLALVEAWDARWPKGTEKAGEFRPKRGGSPGALIPTLQPLKHEIAKLFHHPPHTPVEQREFGKQRAEALGVGKGSGSAWLPGGGGGKPMPKPSFVPAKPEPQEKVAPDLNTVQIAMDKPAPGDHDVFTGRGEDGKKWFVKTYGGDRNRVATELLSAAIYRLFGHAVPNTGVRTVDAGPDFSEMKVRDVGEPPFAPRRPGQRLSTGIIVREKDGRIWLFEPKNHFGGYDHSFPKGGLEEGLSPQQNAHKELWEETGLHARIVGHLGDYEGDTSLSRYYVADRTGGEPTTGPETEAVKLVTLDEAEPMLNKARDKQILTDLSERMAEFPKVAKHADEFPKKNTYVQAVATPAVGGSSWSNKPSAQLAEGFAVDALLANWNVRDGLRFDGGPVRTGVNGTLMYQSRGADEKPFGPVPTELWTMRSPRSSLYGSIDLTDEQVRAQAGEVAAKLPHGTIDSLVNDAGFDGKRSSEVKAALKARVDWMRGLADGKVSLPQPLAGGEVAKSYGKAQQRLVPTQDEQASILAYTIDPAFTDDYLRSKKPLADASEDVEFIVSGLDTLLGDSETPDDAYGYMALSDTQNAAGLVGRTFTPAAYLSINTKPPKKGGYMRVLIPGGAEVVHLATLPHMTDLPPNAPDMLGARGQKVRIVKHESKGGRDVMDAVMLP
jgi:ADP-ribose pyrophosphatase YjhB (NUDIX family)